MPAPFWHFDFQLKRFICGNNKAASSRAGFFLTGYFIPLLLPYKIYPSDCILISTQLDLQAELDKVTAPHQ